MIKRHHLNKNFNLIQENSLLKILVIFSESNNHAETGLSEGRLYFRGRDCLPRPRSEPPAYRQAGVDPFPRNKLNKKHEDPFDLT
jgi:hypothetical protein